MTLKNYIKNLQKIIDDNPEYAELDVIYSKDDEGNGYQHVTYEPCIGINQDGGAYNVEFEGYDEDEHELDEINCVCIN